MRHVSMLLYVSVATLSGVTAAPPKSLDLPEFPKAAGCSNPATRLGEKQTPQPEEFSVVLTLRVRIHHAERDDYTAEQIIQGLKNFYRKTARPDGSFQPGIDPDYRGISDSAYSDLAAVTYAVTIHKTFGWKLPYEEMTVEFLLARQKKDGAVLQRCGHGRPRVAGRPHVQHNAGVGGAARPQAQTAVRSAARLRSDLEGGLQAVAGVFDEFLSTGLSLRLGVPSPRKRTAAFAPSWCRIETGYSNNHVAATFHASHYYRLVGEETPRAKEMVARILRDQKSDGSWLLNLPARDRHATFDAVFTLRHEGKDAGQCREAIARAAAWALSCRNNDGGFGHFPGSPSDADAVYFQVGTLVMAGILKPAAVLPPDPHLLSWGHLMPVVARRERAPQLSLELPGWVAGVAFSPRGDRLAIACSDATARIVDPHSGRELAKCEGHRDIVAAVHFHPTDMLLATGSYDGAAAIWDAASGKLLHRLAGHRGVVTSVAFSPDKTTLASASLDGTIKLWDVATGQLKQTLTGHKSWVNSLVYRTDGDWLVSGSSDGTVIVWSTKTLAALRVLEVTKGEVRTIALSADGTLLAAGLRYGTVKVWSTLDWKERLVMPGSGDMCAVAFSPNGKLLASTEGDWNRDGLLRIHEVATGKPVQHFQHTGEILSLTFSNSDDGHRCRRRGSERQALEDSRRVTVTRARAINLYSSQMAVIWRRTSRTEMTPTGRPDSTTGRCR